MRWASEYIYLMIELGMGTERGDVIEFDNACPRSVSGHVYGTGHQSIAVLNAQLITVLKTIEIRNGDEEDVNILDVGSCVGCRVTGEAEGWEKRSRRSDGRAQTYNSFRDASWDDPDCEGDVGETAGIGIEHRTLSTLYLLLNQAQLQPLPIFVNLKISTMRPAASLSPPSVPIPSASQPPTPPIPPPLPKHRQRAKSSFIQAQPTKIQFDVNQQRESLISSGGTGLGGGGLLAQGPLPVRTSNFPARSPPRDIRRLQQRGYVSGPGVKEDMESIADRFVLPGTSASSSHGQGQGNVRPRTTSALSNLSMSPPREITGASRPSSVVSSRPAFPALLSTAASSSASGLQGVPGLSRSPPRATIMLPSQQQQRDWALSMPVTRAPSTVGGVSGGAGGDWALGLMGASGSTTPDLHLVFLQMAKEQRLIRSPYLNHKKVGTR
ncbi:hypothetical protein K435DRAFT_875620 [Dendrothele bispora CBS 962.96]|uniref:Uncharacterized protein n=1 Tax=Dendrothele bispora (strain CBS 962.96) TaxID=1314807 RepID=A0A4S8KUC4_DENBC|nr:hypothetical protein K435DRAFT_875620 [Dendrothele bispora CBS 962.96]